MAMVAMGNGSGYFLSWSGVDRNNDVANKEWEMTAPDAATAEADAAIIIPQWEALTQCVTTTYFVALRMENDALVTPAAGERQTKAVITVRIDGSVEKATIEIPAPEETIFRALVGDDNKIVDVTNIALLAFVGNFNASAADKLFLSDGEHTDAILRGRKR